jgi:hypothetical protein
LRKTEETSKALNWNSQRQYLKSNLQESSTLTLSRVARFGTTELQCDTTVIIIIII